MPMLHSLGKHGALQSIQDSLQDDEYLFACRDDLYVVCSPECVVFIYKLVERTLEESFRVRGSFSSSVPTHEPRVLSEASHLSKRLSSLRPMMTRLGLVSPRCWCCPSPQNTKVWPASHVLQVAVGCVQTMRSRVPARWASWADCLRMIQRPHPLVADIMIRCLPDF